MADSEREPEMTEEPVDQDKMNQDTKTEPEMAAELDSREDARRKEAEDKEATRKQNYEEIEAMLCVPDAVLDRNVLGLLRRFIQNGGAPAAAIEMLSQGYVGYPAMAALVCDWLALLREDDAISAADAPAPAPGALPQFEVLGRDLQCRTRSKSLRPQ